MHLVVGSHTRLRPLAHARVSCRNWLWLAHGASHATHLTSSTLQSPLRYWPAGHEVRHGLHSTVSENERPSHRPVG